MGKIYFITTQLNKVSSGPGTFARYLHENNKSIYYISFRDQSTDIIYDNKIIWMKKNIHWAIDYYKLGEFINKNNSGRYIFQSALEAMFVNNSINRVIFINDDNYLLGKDIIKNINNKISKKKIISRYILHYIERNIVDKADIIIANSKYIKNKINEIYKIDKSNIEILYKGIDYEYYNKKKTIKDYNKFSFCFIKNDWRRGGLLETINFLNKFVRNNGDSEITVQYIIAGIPNIELNYVRKKISTNIDEVIKYEIYGLLDREELIKKVYTKSNYLLNFAKNEALGVVIMEAIASGIIPILNNVGGISEVVGQEYELFHHEKLHDEINHEKLRSIHNILDQRIKKKFNIKKTIDKFNKIISE